MPLRLHGHGVVTLPRVMIAGLSGDGGKSLVAIGFIRALVNRGLSVAPFKKGPDFIDAAWLGRAARLPGRNLDTFIMPEANILSSVAAASEGADMAVMEGNRGLFDGMTARGDHSSATLAKLTGTPVIIVINVTKTTRTAAAILKGCQVLDPDVTIGGVVINRVATSRQEGVIREAIQNDTGLKVVGAIPKLKEKLLPSRHLGLVTADEHPDADMAVETAAGIAEAYLDIDGILGMASNTTVGATHASPSSDVHASPSSDVHASPSSDAPSLRRDDHLSLDMTIQGDACIAPTDNISQSRPRIGVLRDKAFSFYYPENLSALEDAGAELVMMSPLADKTIPRIDGLYAGGGFPEVYATALSENRPFRDELKKRIDAGLVAWAECGGLMYLARCLHVDGDVLPMVGALSVDVEQTKRPKGHGYVIARTEADSLFFEPGTELRGHEFHYSRIISGLDDSSTVLTLERGVGVGTGRDGIRVRNTVATYSHLHALGTPEWAPGFVAAIKENTL